MANRRDNRPSIVEWDTMCRVWRRTKGRAVSQYFGDFISKNRNFEFTVAKIYHGLYTIGVTWEQYDTIKRELTRKTGQVLPDIKCAELLKSKDADARKKTFQNNNERDHYVTSFIQVNNRRLVSEKRAQVSAHYEEITKMYKAPGEKSIVSFDIEAYELNHDKVLEIGFIVVDLASGKSPVMSEKRHFIIEENVTYKNKDFVTDNRHAFARFAKSETVPLEKAIDEFRRAVTNCAFVIGHSAFHDKDFLKGVGVDLSELKKEIADTQLIDLHTADQLHGDTIRLNGLKKLLENHGVIFNMADLHNAACDAYYTMKVFLRQMGCVASTVNSL